MPGVRDCPMTDETPGGSAGLTRGSNGTRGVHIAWVVTAVAGSVAWLSGPILRWSALQTPCNPDAKCLGFQLDVGAARDLSHHTISMSAYAVGIVVVFTALWAVWFGLSALIVIRKPNDRGALLSAFFFVFLPGLAAGQWLPGNVANDLQPVFLATLLLYGLLFPNGRFEPRAMRWVGLAIVLFSAASELPFLGFLQFAGTPILLALFLAVAGNLVYRFRVLSSWSERQQMKWAVLGLSTAIVGLIAVWTGGVLLPIPSGMGSLYYALVNSPISALLASAIPVTIGISVLRNRLWDIDRIISRALVYAALTVMLASIYVSGVIGLQALFRLLIGAAPAPAIALSTLAIVALFGPLRRRTQIVIDRRFYRSKYDAGKTLTAFSERLRSELDLGQLSQDMTMVVSDALHPEHVSLWLRD